MTSTENQQVVARPELTLGNTTGDGTNGYILSFDDMFNAPSPYTPNQNSNDLEARIAALQTAVTNLKFFLNTYNTNKSYLIDDIKNVRTANVQIASNKAVS